jgi:oligoribonuclease NrnB/cAMP/cGMP phosphodiesterase (DHH superfamily)
MKITKALVDSDFDGVVCGALLVNVFPGLEIKLTEAGVLQSGKITEFIDENCVIADLSYVEGCGLYFDHHHTNKPEGEIKGKWEPLNSAAEVIYNYYKDEVDLERFQELIVELGKFDSGLTTLDDMKALKEYLLMGFAIERQDKEFSLKLIKALAEKEWEDVLQLDFVTEKLSKCRNDIEQYYKYIDSHIFIEGNLAFIDNREFNGNMAHAYFLASKYPHLDAIIMLRQVKAEYRVTMFWNNFKKDGFKYDLLAIANELNPQVSGGHKGACGASLKTDLPVDEIRELIFAKLKQQASSF